MSLKKQQAFYFCVQVGKFFHQINFGFLSKPTDFFSGHNSRRKQWLSCCKTVGVSSEIHLKWCFLYSRFMFREWQITDAHVCLRHHWLFITNITCFVAQIFPNTVLRNIIIQQVSDGPENVSLPPLQYFLFLDFKSHKISFYCSPKDADAEGRAVCFQTAALNLF